MNIPQPTENKLSYLNLEISEKGLSEFSGGKRIIFIPKEKVQVIEVKFGSSAERPVVQAIASIILIALGCAGLEMLSGGLAELRWSLGFIFFGSLGVWFLYETLKKNRYLWVICHKDKRKLVFRGKFEESEYSKFINDASKIGYSIKDVRNNLH